ncbi:MAG: hypothetical protein IK034_00175, partial [Bacilli bacterium]|nr:hypothetical protein [Bacilli bacterium]
SFTLFLLFGPLLQPQIPKLSVLTEGEKKPFLYSRRPQKNSQDQHLFFLKFELTDISPLQILGIRVKH